MPQEKTQQTMRKWLMLVLKIGLSALALYIVWQSIDPKQTWQVLVNAGPGWLLLALVFFNASKIVSALRLELLLNTIQVAVSRKTNLLLYYIGMYYNLFLPGGIGGDGYKVYWLNKNFKAPLKLLVGATLLDRIGGMAALAFLAVFMALFLPNDWPYVWVWPALLVATLLAFPALYVLMLLFFKAFMPAFTSSNLYSLGVQLLQIVCAYFILLALGVHERQLAYFVLFLVSSVVAVLPFTIGGVGARELVFLLGAQWLQTNKDTAVAFSLLFFLITAISSLAGAVMKLPPSAATPVQDS